MKYHPLQSLAVLSAVFVVCHATVYPEVHSKSVLPNTPMSRAIIHSLSGKIYCKGITSYLMPGRELNNPPYKYNDAATDEIINAMKMSSFFFLEGDMHAGKSIKLHISKDATTTPPFVPRQVADSLPPFTVNNLNDIYKELKVSHDSLEASLIKKTINDCEKATNKEQDQYCATSMESMVDFAASKLGKKVKAISTQVSGNENTPLQGYKVKDVKKLNADDGVVVCHREYYAYAVHYCHKASNINVYMVTLVGENNVRAKAVSICHGDTASWNPKHIVFQVLDVKPGTNSVCHFLVENEVAWVPY